jgi:hypothetical protein
MNRVSSTRQVQVQIQVSRDDSTHRRKHTTFPDILARAPALQILRGPAKVLCSQFPWHTSSRVKSLARPLLAEALQGLPLEIQCVWLSDSEAEVQKLSKSHDVSKENGWISCLEKGEVIRFCSANCTSVPLFRNTSSFSVHPNTLFVAALPLR